MAQVHHEDVQRRFDFAYTTVQRLRGEGITTGSLSDARARELIRRAGKTINRATSQWFVPLEVTERFSVDIIETIAHQDNLIPIIKVNNLNVMGTDGSLTLIKSGDYRVDDRLIELVQQPLTGRAGAEARMGGLILGHRSTFRTAGVRHLAVDGVFGWIERRVFSDTHDSRVLSTTLAAEISEGDTQIDVDDASGFRPRDVVIIRNGAAPANFSTRIIVDTVTASPSLLTCDPINLVQAAPAGSTVVTYGQVPEEVEMATIFVISRLRYGAGTSKFAQDKVSARLKSEMTDNYSYSLESSGTGQLASSSVTTGSLEADMILRDFVPPPYVGGA